MAVEWNLLLVIGFFSHELYAKCSPSNNCKVFERQFTEIVDSTGPKIKQFFECQGYKKDVPPVAALNLSQSQVIWVTSKIFKVMDLDINMQVQDLCLFCNKHSLAQHLN